MVSEKIVNYYLLCSVGTGKSAHGMAAFSKKELESLLTRKEQEAFLKIVQGRLIANENVVGGDDTSIMDFILPPRTANHP
jgi:hypothetical protein